jgi:hypothetical protein
MGSRFQTRITIAEGLGFLAVITHCRECCLRLRDDVRGSTKRAERFDQRSKNLPKRWVLIPDSVQYVVRPISQEGGVDIAHQRRNERVEPRETEADQRFRGQPPDPEIIPAKRTHQSCGRSRVADLAKRFCGFPSHPPVIAFQHSDESGNTGPADGHETPANRLSHLSVAYDEAPDEAFDGRVQLLRTRVFHFS